MISRILLFGDTYGIPALLRVIPRKAVCGIVSAGNRPQYHDELREISANINVPFIIHPQPESTDYHDFVRWIRDLLPDLFWSNSYSMKIREDILRIPRAGGLNIHGALLPQFRGCNPTQWAIIKGESRTGVTLHEMTTGIDEGPIIAQAVVPLLFEDTWTDVQDRIASATDRLLAEIVPEILSGSWKAEQQDATVAWYGRRRRLEDGRFSWNDAVVDIYNLIRALVSPHPGAFFEEPGKERVVIDCFLSLDEVIKMKLTHTRENSFLCTERLRLRFLKREDATYFRYSRAERSDAVFFVIEEIESEQVIGSCQLFHINWIHRNAEIQIHFSESTFQEKGYGSEALRLLVDFGFRDLRLHRVYLYVFPSNVSDITMYEQSGFKREAVLREAAYKDGRYADAEVMAILGERNE